MQPSSYTSKLWAWGVSVLCSGLSFSLAGPHVSLSIVFNRLLDMSLHICGQFAKTFKNNYNLAKIHLNKCTHSSVGSEKQAPCVHLGGYLKHHHFELSSSTGSAWGPVAQALQLVSGQKRMEPARTPSTGLPPQLGVGFRCCRRKLLTEGKPQLLRHWWFSCLTARHGAAQAACEGFGVGEFCAVKAAQFGIQTNACRSILLYGCTMLAQRLTVSQHR